MAAAWFYKDEVTPDEIEQGDVLKPTPEMLAILEKYHPHYAQHAANAFYVVLTQSCDLVRRNGEYGTRYVSIAPIRSLRRVLDYEFSRDFTKFGIASPVATSAARGDIERFLERLLNNNEASYFHFFENAAVGITEPMCAMLSLPISLKVEHYDALLQARIVSIAGVFQAKLGWLLGQLYSRIGTPEVPPTELRAGVNRITQSLAVWLSAEELKQVTTLATNFENANQGTVVDDDVLQGFIKNIPKKKKLIVDRVLDVATLAGLCSNPSPERWNFRKALDKDPELAQLLNG